MGLKGLAEGIILQSIEDLWIKDHKKDCIAFFTGKEFRDTAEVAGMSTSEQIKLLNLVKSIIINQGEKKEPKLKSFGQIMRRQGLRRETANSIL